jgi:4,5-DOPA dioxygenase extradiol
MYPDANIPLIQVSMPTSRGPAALAALGRTLAPLTQEGILILGSGNLVHNLGRLDFTERTPPPQWATEFDQWAAEVIQKRDLDSLINFADRAPAPKLAHPNPDHLLPMLVIAGVGDALGLIPCFPLEGFEYGSISRRCVQLG